jgi:xanthine dehydrogenase accessory factor
VGGGILEAQVEQLAAQLITEQRAALQAFSFSGKDAANMDAICGGWVVVLVEWIDPSQAETREVLAGLQAAIEARQKAWLVTVFADTQANTAHALIRCDGQVCGALPGEVSLEAVMESRLPHPLETGGRTVMVEPVQIDGAAYIFGAGHVSHSLAEFTHAVGFWTVVLDDRAEYANRARFPLADEIVVLPSFADAFAGLPIDRDSSIVIVTRGHLNDREVLTQALKTNAGYIGMIGSRHKCELIYQDLRRQGFTEADLQRVHGPVGLPIEAETPEEIGVSIVAEMIQARAKLRKETY